MKFNVIIIHSKGRNEPSQLKKFLGMAKGSRKVLTDVHAVGPALMHCQAIRLATRSRVYPTLIVEDDAIASPWTVRSISDSLDSIDVLSPEAPTIISYYHGKDRPMDSFTEFRNPLWEDGTALMGGLYWTVAYMITPWFLPQMDQRISGMVADKAILKQTDMSMTLTQVARHFKKNSVRYYETSFFDHDSSIPQFSGVKVGRTAENLGKYHK